MSKEWQTIRRTWNQRIEIPRRLFANNNGKFELHVCADACHGAVAYLKNKHEQKAHLILEKSRLNAYNNKATIPKLELQELHLAAKMVEFLKSQLEEHIEKIQF